MVIDTSALIAIFLGDNPHLEVEVRLDQDRISAVVLRGKRRGVVVGVDGDVQSAGVVVIVGDRERAALGVKEGIAAVPFDAAVENAATVLDLVAVGKARGGVAFVAAGDGQKDAGRVRSRVRYGVRGRAGNKQARGAKHHGQTIHSH